MTCHIPSKDAYQIKTMDALSICHASFTRISEALELERTESLWSELCGGGRALSQTAEHRVQRLHSLQGSYWFRPCLKVHEWDPIFFGGEIFRKQQIYGNASLFGLRVCLKVLKGFMPSPKFEIYGWMCFIKTAREWTCLYTCEMEIYPCKPVSIMIPIFERIRYIFMMNRGLWLHSVCRWGFFSVLLRSWCLVLPAAQRTVVSLCFGAQKNKGPWKMLAQENKESSCSCLLGTKSWLRKHDDIITCIIYCPWSNPILS